MDLSASMARMEPNDVTGFISNALVERELVRPANLRSSSKHTVLMRLGNGDQKRISFSFLLKNQIPRNIFKGIFSFSCWNGLGKQGMQWAYALDSSSNNAVWTKNGKKRILILLSDTGGGHKASAKAIQAALDLLYPGVFECEIADIWTDHGPYPFNTFVSSYQWAAKNPWAWRFLYWYGAFPPTRWLSQEWSNAACQNAFNAYIESYRPDAVVSVHPLCQEVPLRVLNRMGGGTRKIPFVTVVTDLGGAHPTWFHKGVDRCFVPGDAVEEMALAHGLSREQVHKHGLPVRQGFWDAGKKRGNNVEMRKQLGLSNVPTVLVVGGGDGVGGLFKTAVSVGKSLSALGQPCQMVVVCGKNDKVRAALERRAWGPGLAVAVQGFVSNMDDWMVAADCLVTKAGPGTIAEAAIVGLPTMLSSYLPGQEAGNVPYVINSGFGDYDADPRRLGAKVAELLSDEARLKDMSAKA
eukprot:CAMPEP_0172183576 /NCGR_PEP_ID=MMETSP1050-20130122/19069_1 /TAXON_ID=233186 /ORGANISM="Cryptomonas curvata, Strain CCAP979/52" /LENGTH=466 /DNA_ID=CAMNT_0012857223 /DNA_START=221 /DNA_END=1618 /DNA_ORIENTATION=+